MEGSSHSGVANKAVTHQRTGNKSNQHSKKPISQKNNKQAKPSKSLVVSGMQAKLLNIGLSTTKKEAQCLAGIGLGESHISYFGCVTPAHTCNK